VVPQPLTTLAMRLRIFDSSALDHPGHEAADVEALQAEVEDHARDLHFFDPTTGLAIGWPGDRTPHQAGAQADSA
jgi:hypothetical protein